MEIITRQEAIENGLKYFYTGKPCKHGHFSPRKVHSYACYQCHLDNTNESRWHDRIIERAACHCGSLVCNLCGNINYEGPKPKGTNQYTGPNKEKYLPNGGVEESPERRLKKLERAREYNKRWVKENPEKHRRKGKRYNHLSKSSEGTYSYSDIDEIYTMQQGRCGNPFCKIDISGGYQVDHYIPVSKGGSSWPDNLQLLCRSCNSRKGAKMPEDWIKYLHDKGHTKNNL